MSAKNIIEKFYESDVIIETDKFVTFLHPEIELEWHSSKGFLHLKYDDIVNLSKDFNRNYIRSKSYITHIIEQDNHVSVRYSQYVKTIENPREEMLLAHFIVIWEVKDNKLYRGYQMSQL
jgi:hypothetical protein